MKRMTWLGIAAVAALAFGSAVPAEEPAAGADAQKAYVEKAAQEQGAVRTPSGMVFIERSPGKGRKPQPTQKVTVHYRGTLIDGKEFDSSLKGGKPVEFRLNQVIPCWTEGLQKMREGAKATLVCPSDLAYRDNGVPGVIPPGATLVFEVELLKVSPF